MSPIRILIVSSIAVFLSTPSFADCMTEDGIQELEVEFGRAWFDRSDAYYEENLHPDFVWIHNHAGLITRSAEEVLGPMRAANQEERPLPFKDRYQTEVTVVIEGNTAVAYGYTHVERPDAWVERTGRPAKNRYSFMRTYVQIDDRCLLLSSQTMEIWQEGQPED